ncbi:MAG: hypothetical protein IPG45_34170 [Deltaproteobacteria bacterium]|nr:hypothetical protein [Deltaproteobacteria bacterium]
MARTLPFFGPKPRIFGLACALALSSLMACGEENSPTPDAGPGMDAQPSDLGTDGGLLDAGGDGGANDAQVRDVGPLDPRPSVVRSVDSSTSGWALGTLRRVALVDLAGGGLGLDDVVWTNGVPGTLPDVGALFVTAATVPDALYAEGARRRVPVIQWPQDDPELLALVGREVVVRARPIFWIGAITPHAHRSDVHVTDVTGFLEPEERTLITRARSRPHLAPSEAVIIPRPLELCAVGQEFVSAWTLHHADPHLSVTPRRLRFTRNTHESLLDRVELRYRNGDQLHAQSGPFDSLPDYNYVEDSDARQHTWRATDGPHQWSFWFSGQELSDHLAPGNLPLVLLDELNLRLDLSHPANLDDPGADFPQERQSIELWPCHALGRRAPVLREVVLPGRGTGRYTVDMGGLMSREYFTTPITEARGLELTGLFPTPLIVTSSLAFTASVEHHNFAEHLIVEPTLDPGLPELTRAALQAADVKLIYLRVESSFSELPGTVTRIQLRGADGTWRAP